MVSQVSTKIGDMGFNIIEFINKSKGNVAYNIIDFDSSGQGHNEMLNEINNIEGVLRVWSIPSDNYL